MSSIPYMPLRVPDYLAETWHMTALECGAYMLLLMAYWQRGKPLPAESDRLANIARMSVEDWRKIEPTIAELFAVADLVWRHTKLDRELDKIAMREIADGLRLHPVEWAELRLDIFSRDGFVCQYCGDASSKLECDHIVPVSKGGNHSPANLITSCFACNRAKRDKVVSIEEWSAIRRRK